MSRMVTQPVTMIPIPTTSHTLVSLHIMLAYLPFKCYQTHFSIPLDDISDGDGILMHSIMHFSCAYCIICCLIDCLCPQCCMSVKEERYTKKELAARNRAPIGGMSTSGRPSSSVQNGSTDRSKRSNPVKTLDFKNKKKQKRTSKL